MMKALLPLYIATSIHLQKGADVVLDKHAALREKRRNGDRGAGALEYAGLVIFGGALVGSIWWAWNEGGGRDTILEAFQKIFRSGE